jgi:hypothetical protein
MVTPKSILFILLIKYAIIGQYQIILFKKEGVKGMLLLGCFPLWGGEGITLQAAAENYRMTLKKRVSHENRKNQI